VLLVAADLDGIDGAFEDGAGAYVSLGPFAGVQPRQRFGPDPRLVGFPCACSTVGERR
jgi:hypothetical protein